MKHHLLAFLIITACPEMYCWTADFSLVEGSARSTIDRDADLIEALIRVGRIDDAIDLCQRQSPPLDPRSDLAAKWAIRHSRILASAALSGRTFGAAEIEKCQQPVTTLLNAYPEHRRGLFLEAQRMSVRQAAAIHQVLRASVSPDRETKMDAVRDLLAATTDLSNLSKRIAEFRSALDRGPRGPAGIDADLNRLQQEIGVDVVSLMLMQTELFTPGSDDCIAAATKAEQAADQAIVRIPADAPARLEMQRLQIEAMLRGGQTKRAANALELLAKSTDKFVSPRIRALKIQIEVASGNQAQAVAELSKFYGDTPNAAPRSIEMDLARLEYLLRFRRDEVGAWFEAIEQRAGRYGRRRAESIALSRIDQRGTDSDADPALLAAEGRNWLRGGEPIRAAELLTAAANLDGNSARALRHATEAAAAFVSADQASEAAAVLIKTSLANSGSGGAASAHLQAAYLLRSSPPEQLEQLLRTQLRTWPGGPVAATARRWLIKHLSDQQRFIEAAEVASEVPSAEITEDQVATLAGAWRTAFHQSTDPSLTEPSRAFQRSMKSLLDSPVVRARYRAIASMLLNRDAMAGLPESEAEPFIEALIRFRQQGTSTSALETVPTEYAADARWRLIRDGRSLPQLRPSIAKLLQKWNAETEPTFEQAELLLWSGDIAASIQMLRGLIQASARDLDALRQSATLLGAAKASIAHQEAIRQWDEIAAGSPQGSRLWHQAKIAAIGLLRRTGDHENANKRAKYILLTMPKIDASLRQQYQSVIQ